MRVLVACEYSGTVRRAFAARGHDAWSCDLLPSEDGSNHHITGDARDVLGDGWDLLMVAHPPCTRLCNSGVRWLSEPPTNPPADATREERAAWPTMTREERLEVIFRHLDDGAALFSAFWNAPIDRVCIENPVMHGHAKARIENYAAPAQSVQPYQYGHGETKRTCLWLRDLPPLVPTYRTWDDFRVAQGLPIDAKPDNRVHRQTPGPDRWKERSRFFSGIADAMAVQWGDLDGLTPDQRDLFDRVA